MKSEDEPRTESTCLDPDQIVDVVGALGPDPIRALAHLFECVECRDNLDTVGAVQAAYAPRPTQATAIKVTERVIDRIAPDGTGALGKVRERPPSDLIRWGIGAANWALAAAAGFFGVMIVGSGNAVAISLQGALMAAALTGLLPIVQGVWFRRTPRVG